MFYFSFFSVFLPYSSIHELVQSLKRTLCFVLKMFWIYILILNMFRCLRSEFRLINRPSTRVPKMQEWCAHVGCLVLSVRPSLQSQMSLRQSSQRWNQRRAAAGVCVCVYVCVCSQLAQTPSHSLLFSKQIWPHGNPSPASMHVIS